jgi:UDP-N-acetylmuramate--alanine ligase
MDKSYKHIYFSGIGGSGISSLALVAKQAGYVVSGSDLKDNDTIKYLRGKNVGDIHIGQDYRQIAEVHSQNPIDWFVYTSALPMDQPDAPELKFCRDNNIKATRRDDFLSHLLQEKNLKMIAVAGTHGKTTTTAMAIWLFKQLGIPISYSVAGKISFGEIGVYDPNSQYFVYEADEYDRNFLAYNPNYSIITGVDWDHPDIYPTRDEYYEAFRQFISQSQQVIIWEDDFNRLKLPESKSLRVLSQDDPQINQSIKLAGQVNRLDAWQVIQLLNMLSEKPLKELATAANQFPGVSRRFEQIAPNLYSDYAHTPPKIRGALQLAREVAGSNVVIVYEGLHNTRQHFIKDELASIFEDVKQLYVVPSYLAREDPNLQLLSPSDLINLMNGQTKSHARPAQIDQQLANIIKKHLNDGDLVLCITAGGGGSLDEWLRKNFKD